MLWFSDRFAVIEYDIWLIFKWTKMELLENIMVTVGVSVSLLMATTAYLVHVHTGDISRKHLSVFLVITALFILSFGPDSLRFNAVFIYFRAVLFLLLLPTLYIYVKSVLTLGNLRTYVSIKHYLPAFIIGTTLGLSIFFSWLKQAEANVLLENEADIRNYHHLIVYGNLLITVTVFLQLFVYAFTIYNTFPSYISRLREYYSSIAPFKPRWVFWVVAGFIAMYVISDIAMVLSVIGYDFYHAAFILLLIGLVLSAAYYGIIMAPLLSYNTHGDLVYTALFHNINSVPEPKAKLPECTPAPKKKDSKPLIAKLELLMEQNKLYLNQEITLYDLATLLGTNTNYLSRAINETYSINFNRYINSLRVEKVIELMKENQKVQYSLWGLGQQAGFYSKSAFIIAFKRITGLTPNEYANQLGQYNPAFTEDLGDVSIEDELHHTSDTEA